MKCATAHWFWCSQDGHCHSFATESKTKHFLMEPCFTFAIFATNHLVYAFRHFAKAPYCIGIWTTLHEWIKFTSASYVFLGKLWHVSIFKTFNQVFTHFRQVINYTRVKRIWRKAQFHGHLLLQKAHNHMNLVFAERDEFLQYRWCSFYQSAKADFLHYF